MARPRLGARIKLRRAGEGEAGGIFVPEFGDDFVGIAHFKVHSALTHLDDGPDADFLPVSSHQLGHIGPIGEVGHHRNFDAERFAILIQAEAIGIALGQPNAVEQLRWLCPDRTRCICGQLHRPDNRDARGQAPAGELRPGPGRPIL